MDPNKLLKGKKILVVDDEPDVLESLIELLDMCKIDTASSFEEGKQRLETERYDIAILDIMGVDGFELLKIANQCETPALMLTAHGLSEENLKRSAEEGACYYAPKEKMHEIHIFVADVLEALEKKKSPWDKVRILNLITLIFSLFPSMQTTRHPESRQRLPKTWRDERRS
jgi:DNA-binding response OmpR family regulator